MPGGSGFVALCEEQSMLSSGLTLLLLYVFSKECYLVLHQNKMVFSMSVGGFLPLVIQHTIEEISDFNFFCRSGLQDLHN